ncbi:MAG: hypothetical protein RQ847_10270 [Wenzhouxiangellaceae bacterium]|nr:hypothetical protein [Wenzhouxiangellaceae bacterium]
MAMRIVVPALLLCVPAPVPAGGFLFAENQENPQLITHPSNYDGSGGIVEVSVCIDETSESVEEMESSVRNAVQRWNEREATSPNLFFGGDNDIPSGRVDFESVVLHELGHCVGLSHPNASSESNLDGSEQNFTKALAGPNGALDLDSGADGIIGSADDRRGNDINLHWFEIGVNNPFLVPATVDGSTMSVDQGELPPGDFFAANADRQVGADLGFFNTEAVMQQGTFGDEAQRTLGADDVATLRLGMSGFDRIEGTSDDYQPRLLFDGVAPAESCDIMIKVSGSGLGVCKVGGVFLGGNSDHIAISQGTIELGSASEINWFFNQTRLGDEIFADDFEGP